MSDSRYGVRQRHPGRFRCCGVLIDSLTPEAATQAMLTSRHGQARRTHLCDTYTLSLALGDTEFRDLLNESDINFPASSRLVKQGRKLAARNLTGHIHAPTLMLDTMSQGREPGLRHYLCGPTPEVVKTLKRTLLEKLPGVDIVATSVLAFPIMPAENAALRKLASDYRPDIVWVGCESPQQDGFVAEYASILGTTLVGVGDAFNVLSGVRPQSRPWTSQLVGSARFGYGALTDKRRSRRLDRVP